MQQLMDNIYLLEIPLEGSPLKWVNCYIIKGREHALVVDTAFRTSPCKSVLFGGLEYLGLPIEDTDFFITHLHVDHSGLCGDVKRSENHVYASQKDALSINQMQTPERLHWLENQAFLRGIPQSEIIHGNEHISHNTGCVVNVNFDILSPGDHLTVDNYHFSVLDLSGHTPGQIGLYDAEHSILFCGDHILDRITPNISTWDYDNDYLAIFLDNLLQVRKLAPKHLFTAHRELPVDAVARIDELMQHHKIRLDEIRYILKSSKRECMTPYQVASLMTWSYSRSFTDFPRLQKWFACSEATAHLQHLFFQNEVLRSDVDTSEPICYQLK